MKIRIHPLNFYQQGNLTLPRNPQLHRLAVDFAMREMGYSADNPPNFSGYAKCWVCCEEDDTGKVVQVTGLSAIRMVPDVEQLRFLNAKAASSLITRMHGFLADNGMSSGSDVFVRIVEGDDPHRCPQYKDWLATEKAEPAERYKLPLR